MRFDDKRSRHERRQSDKLAPIRSVLEKFINNCKDSYSPGEFLTIDEKLEPFKGRCSFIQYIPSKPARYGLKIFVLADAKTFYACNLDVYCGKQPCGPYSGDNSPLSIVHRLIECLKGSN